MRANSSSTTTSAPASCASVASVGGSPCIARASSIPSRRSSTSAFGSASLNPRYFFRAALNLARRRSDRNRRAALRPSRASFASYLPAFPSAEMARARRTSFSVAGSMPRASRPSRSARWISRAASAHSRAFCGVTSPPRGLDPGTPSAHSRTRVPTVLPPARRRSAAFGRRPTAHSIAWATRPAPTVRPAPVNGLPVHAPATSFAGYSTARRTWPVSRADALEVTARSW